MNKLRQASPELREASKQYTNKLKRKLQLIHDLIEIRIKDADKEFKSAVQEQRWSNVSGWHGIGTGLLMAQNIVREELNEL